jgi:hypothetical protein
MIATRTKGLLSCVLFLIVVSGAGFRRTSPAPINSPMATPTTIRQQLVDKLKLRLARIAIANGFQTDIGAALQTPEAREAADWPTNIDELDVREQTQFGIFDRENETTQEFPREKEVGNILPIQVRIYHARKTSPAELRLMLGDVMKAVIENELSGERDPQWRDYDQASGQYVDCSQLATDTKPLRDGFTMPNNVFAIDAAAVEFQVEFLTEPFNAYE